MTLHYSSELNRLKSFYLIRNENITTEDKLKLARKFLYFSASTQEIRCAECPFVSKLRDNDLARVLQHVSNRRYGVAFTNVPIPSPFILDNETRDENIIFKEFRLATFRRIPRVAITEASGTPIEMAERGFYYYKVNNLRCCFCKHVLPYNRVINAQVFAVHKLNLCNPRKRAVERKITAERNRAFPNFQSRLSATSVSRQPPTVNVRRRGNRALLNVADQNLNLRVSQQFDVLQSCETFSCIQQREFKCQYCLLSTISVISFPCSHVLACEECAARIQNCLICRARIVKFWNIYY